MGLVFVPLSTVSFATLPAHLRTDGAAILTLVRNIGSSIGIPVVIATLVHSTSVNHAQYIEHLTPFNDAMKNAGLCAHVRHDDRRRPRHGRQHGDAAGDDHRLFQCVPAADDPDAP